MILYCIVTAFLNVLASVVLGLSVLFKDPGKRQNHLFSWFTVSFAGWSFFYLLWQLAESEGEALHYARLLLGVSTFIPITYYHFVSRLTGTTHRLEIRVGYGLAVIIAAFTPTPYLVSHVEPELMFPYWPKGGPVFIPYILLFAYYTVRAWMVLYTAFRRSSHSRRNQLGYVCFSTVLGWVGGLTNFLLWFDIPIPPVGNGLALVYIMGVGYAMIRFRLVEMNRLALRLVAYSVVVVLVAPIIPAVLWSASRLSGQEVLPTSVVFGAALFISACLFIATQFLRRRVDWLLEGTILREEFRERNRLRSLAQRISSIGSEDEMYEEVILAVTGSLDISGAAIVLRGELESVFAVRAAIGFDDAFKVRFRLEPSDPFVRLLEQSRKAVLLDELEVEAEPDVAARAVALRNDFGIATVVPIHADTFFFGALLLRPRGRHRLFADTDLSILDSICLQIGLNLRSRQLERRASQTEKLISLGTLAAGLAHELRNPLTSIQTFAALLQENGNDPAFQREFGSIMQRDVARIVGIVENISSFATRGTVKFAVLQIGEVIQGAHEITRAAFQHTGVAFRFDNKPMPAIQGNYNQLLQVFINIFQNAIEALGGRPGAEVVVTLTDNSLRTIRPAVDVAIRDNGPGIPPEVLSRIFDPFITTKSTGVRTGRGGTGLGLSIVKRVIDVHHGAIRATSAPGNGTEFMISLPVAGSNS